jgi:hypothetical protein
VKPAAKEVGHTLGGAVRIALAPANFTIWGVDQAVEYARREVLRIFKRKGVPPDRIASPRVELLAPLIQQLRIADQAESLRQLYLNLL